MPEPETLIGRTTELALLAHAYAEARAGRPRTVILEGAAGVGKSAVLRSFLAGLPKETIILVAVGDTSERELPYALLHQLLAGERSDLGSHLADVLVGVAPPPEPLATGVRLLATIGGLQEEGTVVVVVDDAHWADRASLEALTFACRRLRADQVLTLVSIRTGAGSMLPDGLVRLAREPTGQRLTLEGLAPGDLRALSRAVGTGDLSPGMARQLHAHTEGIPLYAVEILQSLEPTALRADEPLLVPPSLASLLLTRLARCSAETRRFVRSAAVLGRESGLELIAAVADLADPGPALAEATAAELLVEPPGRRDGVRFRHPLIRDAVYTDLEPEERARLHLAAAARLDDGAALDHRVQAATTFDRDLAEGLRVRAATEAKAQDWLGAARHLRAAARLDPDGSARSDDLLRAAGMMAAGSDYTGLALLSDRIRALEPGPWRDLVLAHVALGSGRLEEATELLEGTLREGDPEQDPDRYATAAFMLGECRMLRGGRGSEMAELSRLALRLAPHGSVARLAWVGVLFGEAVAGRGREVLAAAPPIDDLVPGPERLGLLLGSAVAHQYLGDLESARRELMQVEGPLVRDGPGPMTWTVLLCRAEVELRAGHWEDALTAAHLGLSIATDMDDHLAIGFHAAEAAGIHALRGEWPEASALSAISERASRDSGIGALRIQHGLGAVRWAWARADPAAVVDAADPLLELADEDAVREHGVCPWRDLYAEALIKLGRLDDAEQEITTLERQAVERDLAVTRVAALRVRGLLEAAHGRSGTALATLEAASGVATSTGMPFLRAVVALELGTLLRRTGSRRRAADRLDEAAVTFRTLAAEPFLQRCERELGGTGRRRAGRGRGHLGLTPQELSVARLVSRGMSNREVAGELVVSVKTVEYHLSNVYGKLGIASRTQLVARFADPVAQVPSPPLDGRDGHASVR